MSENLTAKNPIYPLFGVLTTLILFFGGMALAEDPNCLWLLLGAFGLFLVFGYWRACIAMIPFTAIMALVFCGVTWAATKDPEQTRYAFNRILALCVAIIPGLGMPVEDLTRNLTALHFPRMLVLGMMITFSFFPMLRDEVRRIREAMRTRGAGNPLRRRCSTGLVSSRSSCGSSTSRTHSPSQWRPVDLTGSRSAPSTIPSALKRGISSSWSSSRPGSERR